jgi:predicted DNA-binding transcriptional regulator AlpA
MFKNLLQIEEVAERTGLKLNSLYAYRSRGILPPPRLRFGNVMLFAKEDISYFIRNYKGRPARRDSVRLKKRSRISVRRRRK